MRRRTIAASALASALIPTLWLPTASAQVPRTPSVAGAEVYLIEPKNGATVRSPVRVVMGLRKMGIAPAGTDVPDTGHHHLLIDSPTLPDEDQPIPMDERHRHFGKGQTELMLDLPPGKHTLQLLLGDKNHIPHQPPVVGKVVTIRVKP